MNHTVHCIFAVLRFLVSLGAPLLSVIGVAVSAYGTYLVTRWYHALPKLDFARSAIRIAWLFVSGQKETALSLMSSAAELGDKFGAEDKRETLAGVYVIFFGLALQLVGDGLWILDVILPAVHSNP